MDKKNKRNKSLTLAKAFSLLLIIIAFLCVMVFCTFFSRETTSNYDTLAKKPEFTLSGLFNGSYIEQMIDYYTDTVHNRDSIKEKYAHIKDWFGTGEENEQYIDRSESSEEESDPFADFSLDPSMAEQSEESGTPVISYDPAESSEEPTESSEEPIVSDPTESSEETSTPDPHGDGMEQMEKNALVVEIDGHVWALEVYGGDANLKVIPKYAETLNNFADKLSALGVRVISMPVPKPAAYYLQYTKNYKNSAGNVKRDMDAINKYLSDKVISIDSYNALLPHASENIYFRTDYHWTARGAYYGAQQLAQQLGLPFKSLEEGYTEYKRTGYLGTMYNASGNSTRLLNDPEDFIWYDPTSNYTSTSYEGINFTGGFTHSLIWKTSESKPSSWYYTFLGGDGYISHTISNEVKNGRKVLVVKDSYGNALVPFLTYSFEEIFVVDARTFKTNLTSFVKSNGITDVLFVESIHSAVGSGYVKSLMNLCQ